MKFLMYYRYHKIFFSTFFFLSSLLFFSQEIDVQKKLNLIDSVRGVNPELALKTSDELVLHALKTKDDELFVESQIVAVQLLERQGKVDEAIQKAKEMAQVAKKINNKRLYATSLTLLSYLYNNLGLKEDTQKFNNEILSIYKGEKSNEAYKARGDVLIKQMSEIVYDNSSEHKDSLQQLIYAQKAFTNYEKISTDYEYYDLYHVKALANMAIAHAFINNNDSTIFYANQLINFAKTKNNLEPYILGYATLADAYSKKKDYDKSLEYNFKVLNLFDSLSNLDGLSKQYLHIAELYSIKGDSINSQKYKLKHFSLKDSLDNVKDNARIDAHNQIIGEIKEEQDQYEFISMIVLGILLSLMIIGVIFFKHNRKKSKQKQEEISKKLESVQEDKTADQVKELVVLAKKNDLAFLPTFNKVYPHFRDTLLKRQSKLTTNDIKFCALIKLNFTSKEIAQYTFVSIKTVESKRYRLRKKLELDSTIDLNKWVKNIV